MELTMVMNLMTTGQRARVRDVTEYLMRWDREESTEPNNDVEMSRLNFCAYTERCTTSRKQEICMAKTENPARPFCDRHSKDLEKRKARGADSVLFLWNGRFRIIERPGKIAVVKKLPAPTSFGEHQWVARRNWNTEKKLILKMTEYVRNREDEFAPGKATDIKVRAFERRFRGTELMLDGVPLLTKFWLIQAQIRMVYTKNIQIEMPGKIKGY